MWWLLYAVTSCVESFSWSLLKERTERVKWENVILLLFHIYLFKEAIARIVAADESQVWVHKEVQQVLKNHYTALEVWSYTDVNEFWNFADGRQLQPAWHFSGHWQVHPVSKASFIIKQNNSWKPCSFHHCRKHVLGGCERTTEAQGQLSGLKHSLALGCILARADSGSV